MRRDSFSHSVVVVVARFSQGTKCEDGSDEGIILADDRTWGEGFMEEVQAAASEEDAEKEEEEEGERRKDERRGTTQLLWDEAIDLSDPNRYGREGS